MAQIFFSTAPNMTFKSGTLEGTACAPERKGNVPARSREGRRAFHIMSFLCAQARCSKKAPNQRHAARNSRSPVPLRHSFKKR
eukprot:2422677-Amphidinium_carterae.1